MAYTHNLDVGWSGSSQAPNNNRVSLTGDGEDNRQLSVANSVTDQLVNLAIDISQLKMFVLVSNAVVTIETNSSSAPQETFTLAAGVPVLWYTGCGYAVPFAGDVTKIYVTNASGGTATIDIHILHDSTP